MSTDILGFDRRPLTGGDTLGCMSDARNNGAVTGWLPTPLAEERPIRLSGPAPTKEVRLAIRLFVGADKEEEVWRMLAVGALVFFANCAKLLFDRDRLSNPSCDGLCVGVCGIANPPPPIGGMHPPGAEFLTAASGPIAIRRCCRLVLFAPCIDSSHEAHK